MNSVIPVFEQGKNYRFSLDAYKKEHPIGSYTGWAESCEGLEVKFKEDAFEGPEDVTLGYVSTRETNFQVLREWCIEKEERNYGRRK